MNVTHNTPIPGTDKLVPYTSLCFVKNDRPRLGAVINAINVLSRYDNTACSSQQLPAYLRRPAEQLPVRYSKFEAATIRMHVVYIYTA
jgi:hypothetical protein